ncbi:hypothetical protein WCH_CZ18270 [Waddlia chondrophila 2032/99]|uniref:Quercetin 2,3-dioxygenase C-terminal cupin domain-containing protein n=1 Tax=Waddlia chondrophila 2032/99 TaxID=765953 RepID=F8LCT4_9BACT|nr:hypothetical protein WCH_CZ18270 [Waddlia chondrophila 2032/99]
MRLVASPDGADDSLLIHQDVRIYLVELSSNQSFDFPPIAFNRHAWIQVIRGSMTIDHHSLSSGDGVAISEGKALRFEAKSDAEIMLFDLA